MSTKLDNDALAKELKERLESLISTTRFLFLREPVPARTSRKGKPIAETTRPVACIATIINHESGVAVFSISSCSPKDFFSREVGKFIALGRLLKLRNTEWVKFGPGVHRAIVQKVANNPNLPWRTRNAAILWLKDHKPLTPAEEPKCPSQLS